MSINNGRLAGIQERGHRCPDTLPHAAAARFGQQARCHFCSGALFRKNRIYFGRIGSILGESDLFWENRIYFGRENAVSILLAQERCLCAVQVRLYKRVHAYVRACVRWSKHADMHARVPSSLFDFGKRQFPDLPDLTLLRFVGATRREMWPLAWCQPVPDPPPPPACGMAPTTTSDRLRCCRCHRRRHHVPLVDAEMGVDWVMLDRSATCSTQWRTDPCSHRSMQCATDSVQQVVMQPL